MEQEKNLKELPEEIRKLEIKMVGHKQAKEGLTMQRYILDAEITKEVLNNSDYKNEGQRKIQMRERTMNSEEITKLTVELNDIIGRISLDEIQLNYLKNVFKVELKIDTSTQRELGKVTEKIKELELEETKLVYQATDINEKKTKRTEEINKVIKNKVFKDDEARGKASIERIIKDETIQKCVKEELRIQKEARQVTIDKEYFKRALIIAGISRGIKL